MGTRKSKQALFYFGVDVGFGDVKVTVSNGSDLHPRKMFKFPTAVAKAYEAIKLDNSELRYDYKGKTYILGHEAVHHSNVIATRALSFILEFSPLLVFKAMEMAAAKYHMNMLDMVATDKEVCVGLPLEYFQDNREQLANILESFEVSGLKFNLKDKVRVIAQGQGVLIDFLRGAELKYRQWYGRARTVVILDIGYNTIDVLCVDNGRPSSHASTMLTNCGLCQLVEALRPDLMKNNRHGELSEQEIKKAIENRYFIRFGERIDLDRKIRAKTREYVDRIHRDLELRVGKFLQRSEKLIVAGGGAYYVKEAFEEKYTPEFRYFTPDAEFSNARGYHEFLRIG